MRFSQVAVAATMASAASAVSICDKYTTALLTNNTAANQYALVTLVVKTAALGNFTGNGTTNPTLPGSLVNFKGFLSPAEFMGEQVNLAKYFTGAIASTNVNGAPAAVNWLDTNTTLLVSDPTSLGEDGTNAQVLLTHLVQYFGILLGCSGYGTANYSSYQGVNSQYSVHRYMQISEAEWSYFINQTGESALSFGAELSDVQTIATSLNTTFGYRCAGPAAVVPGDEAVEQVICNGASCPLASSPVAGCTGADAVAGTVVSDDISATASATANLNTANPTGPVETATSGPQASNSEASVGGATPIPTMPTTGNAAPMQTAAVGFAAGAAAIAAAFL